jgi:molybdopterin-guanine dinucleotide biosynthesis protein A
MSGLFTAAILAGGTARRFDGRDKGALLVGGVAILDRQLAAVRPLTDDILIVGGSATRPGVRTVSDRVPGCGPLGGLHAALSESSREAVLVLAGDMPGLTGSFLAWLVSLAVGVDAVVPRTERGYHPLCAVYTRGCLEPAARLLAEGRFRVTDLLDAVRLRRVDGMALARFGDPQQLLANVNTPDEYRQLIARNVHEA